MDFWIILGWWLFGITTLVYAYFLLRYHRLKAENERLRQQGRRIGTVVSVEAKDDGLYATFDMDKEFRTQLINNEMLKHISVDGRDVPVVYRTREEKNGDQRNQS